ncbi:UNVERIFIED_CONTAM: hypothetical protein O8I53_11450 [Campylobacter lari]
MEKEKVVASQTEVKKETKQTIVSKEKLLEAGTYFGHKKSL